MTSCGLSLREGHRSTSPQAPNAHFLPTFVVRQEAGAGPSTHVPVPQQDIPASLGLGLESPRELAAAHPSCVHLVQVLQSGWQVVPDHLHGFERWLIEVGGLPIYHLDHHHPQRPDVHLGGRGAQG